jgi:hypothetical protein
MQTVSQNVALLVAEFLLLQAEKPMRMVNRIITDLICIVYLLCETKIEMKNSNKEI